MNINSGHQSRLVDEIRTLATAALEVKEVGESFHLLVPGDVKHIDITGMVEAAYDSPKRKRGQVQLSSIESFNQYVTDQAREGSSYIYADPDARRLTAVLNDHDFGSGEYPGWRDFRAVYHAELSREFAAWVANDKKVKEQEEFAVFLEDNIADVCAPTGEELLAIALTLQAKTEVAFNSSRRLDNGQVQILYSENIDARAGAGSIEIPREFWIGVRIFKNGDGYKLKARLKYRLGGGKVKFWYELDRPENAIEDAFAAYVSKASESGVPVLLGKP